MVLRHELDNVKREVPSVKIGLLAVVLLISMFYIAMDQSGKFKGNINLPGIDQDIAGMAISTNDVYSLSLQDNAIYIYKNNQPLGIYFDKDYLVRDKDRAIIGSIELHDGIYMLSVNDQLYPLFSAQEKITVDNLKGIFVSELYKK